MRTSYFDFIKKYIQIYDPGYLSFMYASKAMVAIGISALVHYIIFGPQVLVWATMTPIQVFLLNAVLSQQANRKTHMFGFAICSTFAVGFFTVLAQKALASHSFQDVWWLALPILFLSFCVGMARAHSIDLYRMFVPVIVNSLVAAIYVDSGVIVPIEQSMLVVFFGAMIGIIVGFLLLNTPSNYGKYTQVYYPIVLRHFKNMVKNLDSDSDFLRFRSLAFVMIYNLKQTLYAKINFYQNKSIMAKNIKRAIFYIYKLEDIYFMLNILPTYHITKKYPLVQREILFNLNCLSRVFSGHIPQIEWRQVNQILKVESNDEKERALQNILKALYIKMESFCRFDKNADLAFTPPTQKTFKDIIKALDYKNVTFRFSVKYSCAIGLSLIFATLMNINRGIWISLGVVSVAHPSIGGMHNVSKDYFVSAAIGIGIGIILSIFANAYVFYFLFIVLIFLIVYLRVFPFWLWSGFMMCGFVMMYSIIYDDFLHYVIDRLFDIGIGVVFAMMIFKMLWPRFSHNNLKPLLEKQIGILKNIAELLQNFKDNKLSPDYHMIQAKHADFLHNMHELKIALRDSRKEKAEANNQIVVYGGNLTSVLESLIFKMNELTQIFIIYSDEQKHKEYANDIYMLEKRFEKISNLLSQSSDNLHFEEEKYCKNTDTHFAWIVQEIFQNQSQLYNLLDEKHISVPE